MSGKKISLADWQQQLGRPAEEATAAATDDLVYSTDSGRIDKPKQQKAVAQSFTDGHARLRRETKGRNGKAVITISGLAESAEKLAEIAALLKKNAVVVVRSKMALLKFRVINASWCSKS